jgi:hypothetical protein
MRKLSYSFDLGGAGITIGEIAEVHRLCGLSNSLSKALLIPMLIIIVFVGRFAGFCSIGNRILCANRMPDSKLLVGVFGKDGKLAMRLACPVICVKTVLNRGRGAQYVDRQLRTPFHIDCLNIYIILYYIMNCAVIFLQNGADVNAVGNVIRTECHHAAWSDSNHLAVTCAINATYAHIVHSIWMLVFGSFSLLFFYFY